MEGSGSGSSLVPAVDISDVETSDSATRKLLI
jgi:hypothetical protein